MRFTLTISRTFLVLGTGLFLSACNPATNGWTSSKSQDVSMFKLASVKNQCSYHEARNKAVRLLDAPGRRQKNEQRALRVMSAADNCMRRYGYSYRPGSAFAIGRLRSAR